MRNEDDRHPIGFQTANEREEVMFLFRREGRCRFVENDHLGLVMNGAGNFDHLFLSRAELRHIHRRINTEIE